MLTHLKNRPDKFWTNQELMYDYKSSLTGIGNKSSVDNFDDTILVSLLCYESVITAGTLVQAVLMATSHSYGNGQTLTTHTIRTP